MEIYENHTKISLFLDVYDLQNNNRAAHLKTKYESEHATKTIGNMTYEQIDVWPLKG